MQKALRLLPFPKDLIDNCILGKTSASSMSLLNTHAQPADTAQFDRYMPLPERLKSYKPYHRSSIQTLAWT